MTIPATRRDELRRLVALARNGVPDKRPPYGDTEPRFDLDSARAVLANIEHDDATQQNQDTLFVELRMACDEVAILQPLSSAVPSLLDELDASARMVTALESQLDSERRERQAVADRLEVATAANVADRMEIDRLRTALTDALHCWRYPCLTVREKERKDEILAMLDE